MAIEYLAQHGLRPDLGRRPCPPQGRDPLSRFYRSVLKRRMSYANRFNEWRGGRLRPKVIQTMTEPAKQN